MASPGANELTNDELLNKLFERLTIPQIIEAFQARQRQGSKMPVSRRLGVLPITDPINMKFFEEQIGMFWTATEADFSKDKLAFRGLNPQEQMALKMILAIFAFQDGDVIENLVLRFLIEAPTVEAMLYYLAQALVEAVHAHSYSLQIEAIADGEDEMIEMIEAVDNLPCLKMKEELNAKYKNGRMPLAERQVAYAAVEGIGFSGLFAALFGFKERKPFPELYGIFFSNEKIAEDESLHREQGKTMTRLALEDPQLHAQLKTVVSEEIKRAAGELTKERILEILLEFVVVEEECIRNILPQDLDFLKQADLINYVHYITDKLLEDMGLAKHYGVENSLTYMNKIGLDSFPNFFELRVGAYQAVRGRRAKAKKAGVAAKPTTYNLTSDDF